MTNIIGQYKSDILARRGAEYVEFGFWVYVPKFGVLISFDKQICQSMVCL